MKDATGPKPPKYDLFSDAMNRQEKEAEGLCNRKRSSNHVRLESLDDSDHFEAEDVATCKSDIKNEIGTTDSFTVKSTSFHWQASNSQRNERLQGKKLDSCNREYP